jgi:hypothetical protein
MIEFCLTLGCVKFEKREVGHPLVLDLHIIKM